MNNPKVNYEVIPHNQIVRNVRQHFNSDNEMLRALVRAYDEFKRNVKTAIWNIGDMTGDNIFLYDFNPESREFTLMMIDPIAEVSYIRKFKPKSDALNLINYKL